jgi:C-terminal processing protease CtpA/Prc
MSVLGRSFACAVGLLAAVHFSGCYGSSLSAADAGADGSDDALEFDCLADRVDEHWGEAPDQASRLEIFDALWTGLAHYFAAFESTPLDWDLAHDVYRPQVADADSQGRFYAILSLIAHSLRDGHTVITSESIYGPLPDPYWPAALSLAERPPVFWLEDRVSSIGACVTPTDDGSLLVYRAEPDSPAGLAPGDLVLGYDGETWADLLTPILACRLPTVGRPASTAENQRFKMLGSVVNNPHLFDELDVWRHGDAAPEPVATDGLLDHGSDLICSDQVAVAGVEPPCSRWNACYADTYETPQVSWGVLPDTDVGYIYVYSWQGSAGSLFTQAVDELLGSAGLIIDQRSGPGGGPAWEGGLALLFDEDVEDAIVFLERDPESSDYEALIPAAGIDPIGIAADPLTGYSGPIAVLTGPHAGSAGDIFPFLIGQHPTARRFGRPTDGRFGATTYTIANSGDWWPEPDPFAGDFYASFTVAIGVDGDGDHLQGAPPAPEYPVWLVEDQVAAGVDTVVNAALEWIAQMNGS